MASSSSAARSRKYDVFLSFRGEDTRKTFVDHLYSALVQHGILTYKDDVTLDRGDTIAPALLKAIEESQILVIIFSENYADSSWCLDELSHIMKCKERVIGQIVFPIFYHVDPSDVRKQKGQFGKAFAKHNKRNNKVEMWKKALVDATNIAGWEPKHVTNGHEARCIQEIVGSILDKLSSLSDSAVEDEDLVGMETRLKDLKRVLRIGSGGVRMVGIWGIGGGGKTTLATSIYMELKTYGQFHGCCFVENIWEESKQHDGLKSLQQKILSAVFDNKMQHIESVNIGKRTIKGMLCRRNVLIVLDDVDDLEQLEALAGRHDWFGDGSRIIITTRNEQVLISHRVDEIYPVSLLSRDEAIRLFRRHAYHADKPVQDYEKLSLRVISYVNGLPLALKILGSFLYGRDKDEWLSTLARLKDHPEMGIVEKLKISYDGLKDVEKELFLDIACFYRGASKDEAMEILDACGFHPHIGVKVLIQKALISVSTNGMFDMHDLVQEMAHYIVRGEHPNNPEKHSRVWRHQDIKDMCSMNPTTESDKIEGIGYHGFYPSNFIMLVSNMKKLRFLKVTNTLFDEGPSFLSNELRYLNWKRYPASLFPEDFQPLIKLAVLKIDGSLQKELWKGYKYLPCLKELQLVDASRLVRTPDIGGLSCLEKLIIKGCESLEEIHQSLGNHASLVYVFVWKCNKLTRFPSIVRMSKLKTLEISYCRALAEFPKIEAKMDSLVELSLIDVEIEVLPSSVVEYCTNLISFDLSWCSNLNSIEGNFDALKCLENFQVNIYKLGKKIGIGFPMPLSLRKLNLVSCELKDGEIPIEIGELSNLQELHLECNEFTRLHFSLSKLTRLKLLNLSYCYNLVELPELPSSLAILRADLCDSLEVIRDDIHRNCKWLCNVSIINGRKNIIGGERLLETMLQGNAIESRCMILDVEGLEIAKGFIPRLVNGQRCSMQLPPNWFHDFSGFLICIASNLYCHATITMKHVDKLEGGWMGLGDSQHDDVYWEDDYVGMQDKSDVDDCKEENNHDDYDDKRQCTYVRYISFELLRNTLWWDSTSTGIQIEIDSHHVRGCGLKLVSGQMETTTTTTHSSSSDDDYYKCELCIEHDSRFAFNCRLQR